MKSILALLLLAVVVKGLPQTSPTDAEFHNEWKKFQTEFRSNEYTEGSDEEVMRRQIFESNYRLIVRHNMEADNEIHSYRLGVNQFADMTDEEFNEILFRFQPKNYHKNGVKYTHKMSNEELPKSVDWRDKGVVTPVKDQGNCGSCWAFSTVASIEGQLAIKTGKLVPLSAQNLLDCSRAQGSKGCSGSLPDLAFEYVMANHGIDSEDSYPYVGSEQNCSYNAKSKVVSIADYVNVESGDELALKGAVATVGPISVAMDASDNKLRLYKSGVYRNAVCFTHMEGLNHAVTAVGYGSDGGDDYWIIKNSWGAQWGDRGYLKIARNAGNVCGIATTPSYPIGVQ